MKKKVDPIISYCILCMEPVKTHAALIIPPFGHIVHGKCYKELPAHKKEK